MTNTGGDKMPFAGFPGFPPAEMLDKMWDMMRLAPFGASFPGMPGAAPGLSSPLSAMSDLVAPLMNVEELDKRITDLRAVEQWLKLNLNMLQSSIQALEVQRSTLATLRAFGAFAQASMMQPGQSGTSPQPQGTASSGSSGAKGWAAKPAEREAASSATATASHEPAGDEAKEPGAGGGATPDAAPFDPSAWWNLLQSQFNQLAALAMAQPGAAAGAQGPQAGPGAAAAGTGAGGEAATQRPAPKRSAPQKPAGKTSGP
jgi:hypothetical protein